MAAGVGKTYRMLQEGQAEAEAGRDVVIGYLEPHGRADTLTQAEGLELIPRRRVTYQDVTPLFMRDGKLDRSAFLDGYLTPPDPLLHPVRTMAAVVIAVRPALRNLIDPVCRLGQHLCRYVAGIRRPTCTTGTSASTRAPRPRG